jgi:hypothetical protein
MPFYTYQLRPIKLLPNLRGLISPLFIQLIGLYRIGFIICLHVKSVHFKDNSLPLKQIPYVIQDGFKMIFQTGQVEIKS